MTIKKKLILLSTIGLLGMGLIVGTVAAVKTYNGLKEARLAQLESVLESKKGHISSYFDSLSQLLNSMGESKLVKDAVIEFERDFKKISIQTPLNLNTITNELMTHYDEKYLKDVKYNLPDVPKRRDTKEYMPSDVNALIAQYIFIEKNSAKIGEKNANSEVSGFSFDYMNTHKQYHKSFDNVLNNFSLYDVFITNTNGDLIYTCFKEKDFATNLKTGPYKDTGIARVFNKAIKLKEGEIAFDDFEPYEPSYYAAASFIATPIFINGKIKGTLIFQMPIDIIDKVMSFNGKYKEAGLGESGEAYLIGGDYKMRNNSRFLSDMTDEIVKKSGSTIGFFKVETDSTKEALNGKHGSWIIKDYRGVEVLSSYASMDVFNTKWAIIAEIDDEEGLASAYSTIYSIAIISSIAIIIILLLFILLNFRT